MKNDIYIKLDLKYLLPHKKLILCYLQKKQYISIDPIIQNLDNLKEFCIQNLVETHGSRFCQKTYMGYTTIIMDKEYVSIDKERVQIKADEIEFVKCSLIHELLHIASRGNKKSGLLVNYTNSGGLNEGITQLLAETISDYSVEENRNTYMISESCAKLLMLLCGEEKVLKSYFHHTDDLEKETIRLSNDSNFFYYFNNELSTIINLYKYYFHYTNTISKDLESITPAREELAERLYNKKVKLFIKAITLYLFIPKLKELATSEKNQLILEFSSLFKSSPALVKIMNDCTTCTDLEEKKQEFLDEKENLDLQFSLLKDIANTSFVDYFVMENGISYLKYHDLMIKITSPRIEEEILSDSYFSKNDRETLHSFIDFIRRGNVIGKVITIHLDKDIQKRKEKLAAMNQISKKNGYAFDYSNIIYDEEALTVKVSMIRYFRNKKTLK